VREVLKYAVKPGDLKTDAFWLFEITIQLRKLRFIASGGALKHVLRPQEEEETERDLLVHGEGGATDERTAMFFGWHGKHKRYERGDPCFA
jgi:hypothetical protein